MVLSVGESLFIIAICAACTFFERALPFLIFGNRPVPRMIYYLGAILPMAVMATLVVYCVRSVTFTAAAGFVPQLLAVAVTAVLHWWKNNTLVSIVGGTACYMLLVQLVF